MQKIQSFLDPSHPQSQTNDMLFALHEGRLIRRGNLWSDVGKMAQQLPDRPYLFNLCKNRYLFCLVLLAAASRGQICLLPPSGQMAVIREIYHDYPGSYIASEHTPNLPGLEWFRVETPRSEDTALEPRFDWNRIAVIVFTSGSTGKPKPCAHNLETFRISANMAVSNLGFGQQQWLMVSTTSAQHTYGLETSVFWPLFSSLVLYDGHPFFPEDIRRVVGTAPLPVMLATTPTHLRTLTKTSGSWANLIGVLSATEALSEKLARDTDSVLGQSPVEIYGSTETLSFACREILRECLWQPYAGIRLIQPKMGLTYLESPHLQTSVHLQDIFRIEADGRFAVLGRDIDMVKIGGKRASLSELNQRLRNIVGVDDGFCFVHEDGPNDGRLVAVVVSRLDKRGIWEGLQSYVDNVFLPRKIHFVDSIPRNEVGKLPKAEMEKLLASLG